MYKSNFFHPLPDDIIIFSDDNFFGGDSADVDWAQEKNKNKSDWKERQTEDTAVGGCKGHLLHQMPSNVNDTAAGVGDRLDQSEAQEVLEF